MGFTLGGLAELDDSETRLLLAVDADGRVTEATILTPTAQNVANLEADMRLLAEKLVGEGRSEAAIRLEVEKLVRAYDPCLSCSVH